MSRVQRLAYLGLPALPGAAFLWVAFDFLKFWVWWRRQTGDASLGGPLGLLLIPGIPLGLTIWATARRSVAAAIFMAVLSLFGSYLTWLTTRV